MNNRVAAQGEIRLTWSVNDCTHFKNIYDHYSHVCEYLESYARAELREGPQPPLSSFVGKFENIW